MSLSASSDLKSWRNLASDVPVFEFPSADASAGAGPVNRRINLPAGTRLKDQYLRLTWSGAGAGALPVTALRAIGVGDVPSVPPVVLDLGPPASTSEDAAQWTLPSALRAQGLRLSTSADQRIDAGADQHGPCRRTVAGGRHQRGLPAGRRRRRCQRQPVAAAALRARTGSSGGGAARLQAERRAADTGTGIPPLHALFVATGPGPFTIASGKAGWHPPAARWRP